MTAMPLAVQDDDPRRLRALLDKVVNLADDHSVRSVVIGMSGVEGDLLFPEAVQFVASALRVDDSIFRMMRNRVVFFVADVDQERAEEIMERVLHDFSVRFPTSEPVRVSMSYFEVTPGMEGVTLKEVLPALFAPPPDTH
jgi:hypothetical protein